MERVETLIEKLQEQLNKKVAAKELLMTVQMIESELLHIIATQPDTSAPATVAIDIPELAIPGPEITETAAPRDKVIFELDIDPSAVEEELEKMRKSAEVKMNTGIKNKPPLQFEDFEEIPTLFQQRTVQQPASTDTKQAEAEKESLNEALSDAPIKDLKKAISLNDRFLFINELFKGDEAMFERSVKTINAFSIYPEAEFWIRRELLLKMGWDEKSATVKQFSQLVKRRFSAT